MVDSFRNKASDSLYEWIIESNDSFKNRFIQERNTTVLLWDAQMFYSALFVTSFIGKTEKADTVLSIM